MRTTPWRLSPLLLVAVLTGCVARHSAPAPVVACDQSGALPKELLEPGSVVLFGEIHGSQELPAIFGEAVCTAAASGLAVEVGFEQPRGEQASVDAFLESTGEAADVAALLATPFWSREYRDGRSSQARVDLLERLRQLRMAGLPVHAFLYDIDPGEDATRREARMAENIAAHARAHAHALTTTLVGEVHAWTTEGAPWDPAFLPMGWQVAQAGLQVRSLGRATPRGTAWICTSATASDCGPRETGATAPLPSGRTNGIELLPERSPRGYVGLFGTQTLTASPPA